MEKESEKESDKSTAKIKNKNKNNTQSSEYRQLSEYRHSNTSEYSNNEDNIFFSPNNSPLLTSNNYSQLEQIPLLKEKLGNNINEDNENNDNNENNENNDNNDNNENNENNEGNKDMSNCYNILNNEFLEKYKTHKFTLDSLILNLKIISKIKPGYKLSVKDNLEIYIDTSYLQSFYRIFSDNSRGITTNFLEILDIQITQKIEEIIKKNEEMFLNSKENILLNLNHNLSLLSTNFK